MKASYWNCILTHLGDPILAQITVFEAGTEQLAALYANSTGTISKDNPFSTDAIGRFSFYADPGHYDLYIDAIGMTPYTIYDVPLHLVALEYVAEKLTDGDMEVWASSSDLTYYVEYISGGSYLIWEGTEKVKGNYSCAFHIDNVSATVHIKQTNRVLTPLRRCRASTWYKNSLPGKICGMVVRDSGWNVYLKSDGTWSSSYETIWLENSTVWKEFELEFFAHASYSTYEVIWISGSAADSVIYWDDAHLQEIEPRRILGATAPWDPPSMTAGGVAGVDITVPGVVPGDPCFGSFSALGANDVLISAWVKAADTVRLLLRNETGSTLDLPSGTARVYVIVP